MNFDPTMQYTVGVYYKPETITPGAAAAGAVPAGCSVFLQSLPGTLDATATVSAPSSDYSLLSGTFTPASPDFTLSLGVAPSTGNCVIDLDDITITPLTSGAGSGTTTSAATTMITTTSTSAASTTTSSILSLPTGTDLSFEDSDGNGGAAGWTPVALSGPAKRVAGDGTAADGKAYLEITASTLNPASLVAQLFNNFQIGHTYTITVQYKPKSFVRDTLALVPTCTAEILVSGVGVPTTADGSVAATQYRSISTTVTAALDTYLIELGVLAQEGTCVVDFDAITIVDDGAVLVQ